MALIDETWIADTMHKVIDGFLLPRFDELEMEASGEWRESLEVLTRPGVGIIRGRHYSWQLEFGRKPGKRPPIAAIEAWVKVKLGLQGREALSAAFAIANKIAAEGTTWLNNQNQLISVLASQEVADFVRAELARAARVKLIKELFEEREKLRKQKS